MQTLDTTAAQIASPDYVYGAPLMQSRNGGKVHFQGCGQRSMHARFLKGTDTLSRAELVEEFGTDLCRYCFPELQDIAPATNAEKKNVDENICPATGTRNWANGTSFPDVWITGGYNLHGICGHCGQDVRPASNYNNKIRKHTIK